MGGFARIKSRWQRHFPSLVEKMYEKVAKDILVFHQSSIGRFSRMGRYWDAEVEIDLVAVDEEGGRVFFGEAKWSNKKVGNNIYDELLAKSSQIKLERRGVKKTFALFSKSGFTNDMLRLAKEKGVFLFYQNELLKI